MGTIFKDGIAYTHLRQDIGGGGIPEAPIDDNTYGRSNGDWKEINPEGGGLPDAPSDGKLYGRQDENWKPIPENEGIPEAPDDDKIYGRGSKEWKEIPESGIPEAPIDGTTYGRKDGDWEKVNEFPEAPEDGKQYARKDGDWSEVVIPETEQIWERGDGENSAVLKGGGNAADGDFSVAEGYGNSITKESGVEHSGDYAHAEGMHTSTSGPASHAEGQGTVASNIAEHAEGRGNVSHKDTNDFGSAGNTLHSIGIGNPDDARFHKNAVEVMQNGDVYINGIGGYDGIHIKSEDPAVKTLQEVVNGSKKTVIEVEVLPDESSREDALYFLTKDSTDNKAGLYAFVDGGWFAIKLLVNAYDWLRKKQDFLFEAQYSKYDWNTANAYFEKNFGDLMIGGGGCSALRRGQYLGGTLDWYYSNLAEFVIHTTADSIRLASLAVGGNMHTLTNEIATSEAYSKSYEILPFLVTDGINERGVTVKVNVVPIGDKGRTTGTNPGKPRLCGLAIPRYILDNFSSAQEAVNYIANEMDVYMPYGATMQEEFHYIVADGRKTFVLEFVGNAPVIIESQTMTNFHLQGVVFNADGTIQWDTVEDHGMGLERYEQIMSFGSFSDKETMEKVLESLLYTQAYTKEVSRGLPLWKTEFTTTDYHGKNLTVTTPVEEYREIWDEARTKFFNRDRATEQTWHTEHMSLYDIFDRKLYLKVQEELGVEYEFSIEADDPEPPTPPTDDNTLKYFAAIESEDPITIRLVDDFQPTKNNEIIANGTQRHIFFRVTAVESADILATITDIQQSGDFTYINGYTFFDGKKFEVRLQYQGETLLNGSVMPERGGDGFVSYSQKQDLSEREKDTAVNNIDAVAVRNDAASLATQVRRVVTLYEDEFNELLARDAVRDDTKYIVLVESQTLSYFTYTTKDSSILGLPSTHPNLRDIKVKSEEYKDGYCEVGYTGELQFVGGDIFTGKTSLQTIDLPASVIEIGDAAFAGCVNLTSVGNLFRQIKRIPSKAFANTGLYDLNLEDNIQEIGSTAFYWCTGLQKIMLPTLTSIGETAFDNCSHLVEVYIKSKTVFYVAPTAFDKTTVQVIYVPTESVDDWRVMLPGFNVQPYNF